MFLPLVFQSFENAYRWLEVGLFIRTSTDMVAMKLVPFSENARFLQSLLRDTLNCEWLAVVVLVANAPN